MNYRIMTEPSTTSPQPLPRTRVNSQQQSNVLPGRPQSREAWANGSPTVDQMYTDHVHVDEEIVVESDEDSDEFQDPELQSPIGSPYHLPDPLQGFSTQSNPSKEPPSSLPEFAARTPAKTTVVSATRSSSTSFDDGMLLRREVTDLKNKKKLLESQLSQLQATLSSAKDLKRKEDCLEEKEMALKIRQKDLLEREQSLAMERGNIGLRMKTLTNKERELEKTEGNLVIRKKQLDEREYLLSEMAEDVEGGSRHMDAGERRESEEKLQKREMRLTDWSRRLHEEAEQLRIQKLKLEQEFQDKMAAMSFHQQEYVHSSQEKGAVGDPIKPPESEKDREIAASLQEKIWQDPSYDDEDFARKLQEAEMVSRSQNEKESEDLARMLSQQLNTYEQQRRDEEMAKSLAKELERGDSTSLPEQSSEQ